MSQTETSISKKEVIKLIFPALNVLRAIDLGLPEHQCIYQERVKEATNNLAKLVYLASDKY